MARMRLRGNAWLTAVLIIYPPRVHERRRRHLERNRPCRPERTLQAWRDFRMLMEARTFATNADTMDAAIAAIDAQIVATFARVTTE